MPDESIFQKYYKKEEFVDRRSLKEKDAIDVIIQEIYEIILKKT